MLDCQSKMPGQDVRLALLALALAPGVSHPSLVHAGDVDLVLLLLVIHRCSAGLQSEMHDPLMICGHYFATPPVPASSDH